MSDHKADAVLWLDNAVSAQAAHDDAGAAIFASIAQVHATLAVVEQQGGGEVGLCPHGYFPCATCFHQELADAYARSGLR